MIVPERGLHDPGRKLRHLRKVLLDQGRASLVLVIRCLYFVEIV